MRIPLPFVPGACIALGCAFLLPARAATPPGGIVAALEKKYSVTDMTPDRQQVAREGAVMALRSGGVYSEPADRFAPDNKVADGKVLASGVAKFFYSKTTHILQPGERIYLTKIETKPETKEDLLRLTIVTVNSFDVPGRDEQSKYAASLSFHFKKGYLDEAPPEDLEQDIDAVMGPDTSAPAPAAPAQAVAPVAPPPPPPPPPAPAGPPPTITIGESSTQVLQALGMPQQMVDLGKKKTYIYKSLNMKIIFVDDKVSDVQ
jgi:hypothetical protein